MNLLQQILGIGNRDNTGRGKQMSQMNARMLQQPQAYNPYTEDAYEQPQGLQVQGQQGFPMQQPHGYQGGGQNPIDPQFGAVGEYAKYGSIQGGQFNPGTTPMQGSLNVRPIQGRNSNWN